MDTWKKVLSNFPNKILYRKKTGEDLKLKHKTKSFWRLLCYALGSKAGKDNREADLVAIIRLLFVIQVITTNTFIILGVVRHFNDNHQTNISTIK